MPLQKLKLRPGINAQRTLLLNEGGWSSCNLIRFREGMPELMGGWVPFLNAAVQGVCRSLHAWTSLAGQQIAGVGTHLRLYIIEGGVAFDITPIVQTTTPTSPFTTIAGSSIVAVSDPALATLLSIGSFIEISGSAAVGGLTLAGEYVVQSVSSGTTYTIQAAANAASSATGGGTRSRQRRRSWTV